MNKWMLLMPLALMACGDKTDDTSTEEGGEETTSIEPQDGSWTMTALETTEDTCGMEEGDTGSADNDSDPLTLTNNADGTFSLAIDEDITFTCSLSGSDFTCDPVVMSEEDAEMNMTFNQTFNLSGMFSSNTALDANVDIEMSCEGEGCAMLEQFGMTMPCNMVGTFSATAD